MLCLNAPLMSCVKILTNEPPRIEILIFSQKSDIIYIENERENK